MVDIANAFNGVPLPGDEADRMQLNRQTIQNAQLQHQQIVAAAQKAMQDQAALKAARDLAIAQPTAKNFAALTLLNPKEHEGIKSAFDGLEKSEQQASLRDLSAVRGYLKAGKPDMAKALVQRRIDADRKAGQDTSDDEQMLEIIGQDPTAAGGYVDYMLAGVMGPEKWSGTFESIGKEERANLAAPFERNKLMQEGKEAQARADAIPQTTAATVQNAETAAAKAQADIANAAARLDLDRDALQSNVQLKLEELNSKGVAMSPASESAMTAAVVSAEGSRSLANRAKEAREKIEADANFSGGWPAVLAQGLTGMSGKDSPQQQLRRQYEALMISQAIKNLPPGPASDKDVKMAMKGFPDRNANKETIASFLRGMEKLQTIAANRDQARADWISENGDVGRAKRDIVVNGVRVPKGATFGEFSTSAAAGERRENAAERSYMRFGGE